MRELAAGATPERLKEAVLAFVNALRDRAVDEDLIAGMFYRLCAALGIPQA